MRFAEIRGSGLGSVIAENNSTKFYIKVFGANRDLPTEIEHQAGVYVNDVRIPKVVGRGINIAKFTKDMVHVETVSFDLYQYFDAQKARLIDYMNNAGDSILCLYTFDALANDAALNTFFKRLGASAWCYHRTGQFRYSYAAIYDAKRKNIVSDGCADRQSTFPAVIDYYIDTADDLGVTGAGNVLVQDSTEYSGKDRYLIKRWYDQSKIVDVFPWLNPGDNFYLQAEMKIDAEGAANGVKAFVTFQFYDVNRAYLRGFSVETTNQNYTVIKNASPEVPANAVYFDMGFYHGPSSNVSKGIVYCKNVVAQPAVRELAQKSKSPRFGRFTAPSKEFREGTIGGTTVVRMSKDELIEANEMQEIVSGEWIKVFEHRLLDKGYVFPNLDAGLYSETPHLYSNMKMLPDLRLSDGTWKFKIVYPEGHIIWTQKLSVETTDPNATNAGVKIIEETIPGRKAFYGIYKTTGSDLNNARYAGSVLGNWYYALGAIKLWNSGIPGPIDTKTVKEVQLYAWKE